MALYRCLTLDTTRRVIAERSLEAWSDSDIIRAVRTMSDQTDCEIWQFTRCVALIPAQGGLPIMPAWR